jgi:hypothetical protein
MRQFPVKIHHHHAPGYIAAKLQNTAKKRQYCFPSNKQYKCIHLVHRKSLRMLKQAVLLASDRR